MRQPLLFHGGVPGLNVGDEILPPSRAGSAPSTFLATLSAGLNNISQRTDRVYMTTRLDLALAYAGMWTAPGATRPGGGAVYLVAVAEANLAADPDLLSLAGVSYQAQSAVITEVYRAEVGFNRAKFAKTFKDVLRDHAVAKRKNQILPRA